MGSRCAEYYRNQRAREYRVLSCFLPSVVPLSFSFVLLHMESTLPCICGHDDRLFAVCLIKYIIYDTDLPPVILGLVRYGHHGMAGAECNGHARAENACSFFLFPGRTSRTRSRFRPYLTHVPSLASEVESKYLTTIRACTRHWRPSSLESGLTPRSILTM